MTGLNREWLTAHSVPDRSPRDIRVVQFGEGNFLRAFCDRMIDQANEAMDLGLGVAVVQPIAQGLAGLLAQQDCLFTVLLRGMEDGHKVSGSRVVQCVRCALDPYTQYDDYLALARLDTLRFVISNTTEAGIVYTGTDQYNDVPPASYPGKLTRFLHERYQSGLGGLIIIPCELIDHNGAALREAVLCTCAQWGLGEGFATWIHDENIFCSTLVDRIVTGYPRAEAEELCAQLGYTDRLLDVAEPFGLWVIQAPLSVRTELPLDKAGCPVVYTDDVTPYKIRKVRVLNGAHTAMVPAAFLSGLDTVLDCMRDAGVRAFISHALFNEIVPVVPLPREEVMAFAAAVCQRFENPFNRHMLLSIALNSVSKYAARVLPTLEEYTSARGEPPRCLTFGLAALIMMYAGARINSANEYEGVRDGKPFPVKDDGHVLLAFSRLSCDMPPEQLAYAVLADHQLWDRDLRVIPGLEELLASQVRDIQLLGIRAAMDKARGDQP
jgi:tagaturonate reductase